MTAPPRRPATPLATPIALRARAEVRPDLWPLDRPPPAGVHDPGPRTVVRDGGDTDEVVAASRAAVQTDPARWTGVLDDLPVEVRARAGREVAATIAADLPARLSLTTDGTAALGDLAITVDADGQVAPPVGDPSAPVGDHCAPVGDLAAHLRDRAPHDRLLHLAGLAVAEDLVLLEPGGTVVWLHVTAPTGWEPAAAVGAPIVALHRPVPDAGRLRAASRALARAVVRGGPFVRWTWGITATPALAQPPDHPAETLPDDVGGWTFRAERQTTAALPNAGLGLFTIRVHRTSLREVIDGPARAREMARTVEAMSPAMAVYKGLDADRGRLLAWLEERR